MDTTETTNKSETGAERGSMESGVRRSRRSLLRDPFPWLMLAVIFGADQVSKLFVIANLERGESWPTDGFFRFTHAWNTGTAFSLFQDQSNILIFVSLLAVVLLFWVYRSANEPSLLVRAAFGMQLGGALGNVIDRIRLGHVTDFIDVGPWPIFNVADSAIVVGIALMVYYFWLRPEDQPSEQQAKDSGDPPEDADSNRSE